ncbi:MAG: LPS export ABC transporter periplasmic protein LptC [Bacteroidales bacterium]
MLSRQQGYDKRKRLLRASFNVVAILIVTTLLTVCSKKENTLSLSKTTIDSLLKVPPIMYQENFLMTYTDSGHITTSISGAVVQQFADEEEYTEFSKGLEVLRFAQDGTQTSSLKADYAKEFAKQKQWEARGNVIATNAKGDTLKTEYLLWDEKKNKISSDQFVEFVNEGNTIRGIGFISSTDMTDWRILKSAADLLFDK